MGPLVCGGRAADHSFVMFVVEDDNRQVRRRLFTDGAERAEVKKHPAVGIESDHAPMRHIQRDSQRKRRRAPQQIGKHRSVARHQRVPLGLEAADRGYDEILDP